MPVTFTAIGTNLDASIVDGNFDDLQRYLQEEVVGGDFNDSKFTRVTFRRFSHGKVVQAVTRAEEILDFPQADYEQNHSFHEVTFRANKSGWALDKDAQERQYMEFLGIPGPSFYWQYQEDGISYGAAPDPARYDPSQCYSYWLTVPGASLKVYVPEDCILRAHGRAYFISTVNQVCEWWTLVSQAAWSAGTTFRTEGAAFSIRFGLVADTNPNVYDNIFSNTNPNIIDPATGAMAAWKSWSVFADKSVHAGLWQREDISGEVVLKGGHWYNFSMKYRGTGAMGYISGGSFVRWHLRARCCCSSELGTLESTTLLLSKLLLFLLTR